jgi:hypothetical protein
MERNYLKECKNLLGQNFIGPEELVSISTRLGLFVPETIPVPPYSAEILKECANTHLLVLMVSQFTDGTAVSIMSLRDKFGIDPYVAVPCFYNQDWYVNESFSKKTAEQKWILVSKNLIDSTRALRPEQIELAKPFPSAIECVYAFFVNYLVTGGEKIWECDYVWCSDLDDKGDRIYVGRYTDPNGLNKDGFEIHRHLSIKNNYGAIDNI